jgi:septum formation inhibitor-activating ATPase MinD
MKSRWTFDYVIISCEHGFAMVQKSYSITDDCLISELPIQHATRDAVRAYGLNLSQKWETRSESHRVIVWLLVYSPIAPLLKSS